MSRLGKRWEMTVEEFLGIPTKPAESSDQSRLIRVIEAINIVSQSDAASIRHGLLLAFLYALVETIRAANRNRPDSKAFSRRALADAISPINMNLQKALRAGGRIARLFGRDVGYLFSLRVGSDYM